MKLFKTLILSIAALGTVAVSSCSKDDNNKTASGTITASIDGSAATFNKNIIAGISAAGNTNFTTIQGSDAAGNSLSIILTGVLTPGKVFTSNASNEQDRPIVTYTAVNGDSYVNDDSAVSNIVTVTISAEASNTVQGTFSGKLSTLVVGNGAVKSKTVTDGKFNVSLSN